MLTNFREFQGSLLKVYPIFAVSEVWQKVKIGISLQGGSKTCGLFGIKAKKMAPTAGFEPATKWLTATYSTAELCRNI